MAFCQSFMTELCKYIGADTDVPAGDIGTGAFVHGAMCISYSGRCLLSNYFTGRDANRGACTHPCRWKYAVMEESRPGEYLPVYENERGTFIFNSKDLCITDNIIRLWFHHIYHHFDNMARCTELSINTCRR